MEDDPSAARTDSSEVKGGAMTSSIERDAGIFPASSRTKSAASEAGLFIFQLPTIRGMRTIEPFRMAWEQIYLSSAIG